MQTAKEFSSAMIDFIDRSPSPFHAVVNAVSMLNEAGFTKLDLRDPWHLQEGGKYFCTKNDSALIAFVVPSVRSETLRYRLIGSHTDSPTIKIKPEAPINFDEKAVKINTEIYGGPLLYTWFDRPLSIAGKVVYQGEQGTASTLVNYEEAVGIVPSLAIHLNREVNQKGMPIANQKDMIPLISVIGKDQFNKEYLISSLASRIGVDKGTLLDYELNFYEAARGAIIGISGDLVSSARLDNLSMFYTSIRALLDAPADSPVLSIAAGFDNEEVGSKSKQGAASSLMTYIIERIYLTLGKERDEFIRGAMGSFIISADLSHAVHPNNPDKSDPVSKNYINSGLALKYNYSQSYTTDADSTSKIIALCKKNEISCQKYVNHSDNRGGGTIGPSISALLGSDCVDIGVGVLGMHSIRELGGVEDFYSMFRLMNAFYGDHELI